MFQEVNYEKIKFTYGDAMQPNYIYREEEAIITEIQKIIYYFLLSVVL